MILELLVNEKQTFTLPPVDLKYFYMEGTNNITTAAS